MPEIWLMAGCRAAITVALLLTVLLDPLREQMHWVVLALIGGLLLAARQALQVQTRRLRNQNLLDLAVFITVVPALVISGFVAAGPDEPLPAERSAFIQTSVALLLALIVVAALCVWLFSREPADIATMFLPAALIVISLPFVLHDYRDQTVLGMLAMSYFLSTVSIPFSMVVDAAIRRYIGALLAGLTVLAGVLLFDPGLGNLGERAELIQIVTWGFILLVVLALIGLPRLAVLVPELMTGNGRQQELSQTIRDRRFDDSGRSAEEPG